MKRTYQENKSLYEAIMRDVAKIVKSRINESTDNDLEPDDSSDTIDDYKNLRDLSKFGTDNDYITFGYSYKISDLKNPQLQLQRNIIHTLHNRFPSKGTPYYGMLKRNGKECVVICAKLKIIRTDEVANFGFTAKTIYEALLMLQILIYVTLYDTKEFLEIECDDNVLNMLRKDVCNSLSDTEQNELELHAKRFSQYIKNNLTDKYSINEYISVIKKGFYKFYVNK